MNTEIKQQEPLPENIVGEVTAANYTLSDFNWHGDRYGVFYTASFSHKEDPTDRRRSGVITNYFEIDDNIRTSREQQIEDLKKNGFNALGQSIADIEKHIVIGAVEMEDTLYTVEGRLIAEEASKSKNLTNENQTSIVNKAQEDAVRIAQHMSFCGNKRK